MKKDIRQQKILDYLSHFGRVSISEICEMFDIVPMTARRDLKELEDDHKLIRTHGGATLPSLSIHDTTLPFHQRMTQNIELKESIARAALPYVQNQHHNETLSMNDDNPYITLMVYWQYRAERVGMEQDCAGIMRVDGSARPVAYAAKDFGEDLHKNMQYLAGAEVEEGDIAIVFDFDSLLMSEIEEASKDIFQYAYTPMSFTTQEAIRVCTSSSETAVTMWTIQVPHVPKHSKSIRCFTSLTILCLTKKIVPYLEKFLQNGGTIIADEGFGLRDLLG